MTACRRRAKDSTDRPMLPDSLDRRCNGLGGPGDLDAIVPYATTETARNHLNGTWEGAPTALLGRVDAEAGTGTGCSTVSQLPRGGSHTTKQASWESWP